MKTIELTQGKVALVDDEDYEYLSKFKWGIMYCGVDRVINYARSYKKNNGKFECILMHRLIMGPGSGSQVDHIDSNGLNNQRSNLRICSRSQNQMNKRSAVRSTSQYKGVYFASRERKFCADITHCGKHIHIGYFTDEKLAAIAYNSYAIRYFGEFAKLNEVQ